MAKSVLDQNCGVCRGGPDTGDDLQSARIPLVSLPRLHIPPQSNNYQENYKRKVDPRPHNFTTIYIK